MWPLHTPGHSAGMLSFLVGDRRVGAQAPDAGDVAPEGRRAKRARAQRSSAPGGFSGGEAAVFTGDTLFKDSVGGVRAPGHTTYTDLRDSIMGTLMELGGETTIYPGRAGETKRRTRVGGTIRSSACGADWTPRGAPLCCAGSSPRR